VHRIPFEDNTLQGIVRQSMSQQDVCQLFCQFFVNFFSMIFDQYRLSIQIKIDEVSMIFSSSKIKTNQSQ